jgi:hypothetical protein
LKPKHCIKCGFKIIQYIHTLNSSSYVCEKDILHSIIK